MQKWNSFDTRWMLSLFGTAVGAGILFLPIRAGTGGFWPVVIMSILIFPMIWLSHTNLSRFVNESTSNTDDITMVSRQHWGGGASLFITVLYFFAIYPICLAYGVGITNTFASFFINQLNITFLFDAQTKELYPMARIGLAFVLVSLMMAIMLLSEDLITKICNILVYPLCLILFAFSLYLIPYWKLEIMHSVPSFDEFISVIWFTLPVLVFSFNHSPAISTFTLSVKKEYKSNSSFKSNQILFRTSLMLLFFVMFFVFSCILCLDSNDFQAARDSNIPILSYFANQLDNPLISYGAPIVAFLAIVTSFFGHYFGAYEGLNGIVRKTVGGFSKKEMINTRSIKVFSYIFMYITIILVAYINPSILGFIEDLGGPIIAMILFIMPLIGIYTVPSLKKYKNTTLDIFVAITGLLTIASVIYKIM